MRFPKPPFKLLLEKYDPSPLSVHDCPRIYMKDYEQRTASVNTCAIRITEALVLANRIIGSRTEIAQLTSRGGDGKGFLLGKYGYKNNLCPHGIGRGARDVAYFLQEQWGKPTMAWDKPMKQPIELVNLTGVIAFIKILGVEDVQGHMDVWNQSNAVGSAYFESEKVWFWRLE